MKVGSPSGAMNTVQPSVMSGRVAYRKNLTGVFPAPVAAYWNIGKA